MPSFCSECGAPRPHGPLINGRRLCVPCGDKDAAYWKERALASEARVSREETEHLKTMAELDEANAALAAVEEQIKACPIGWVEVSCSHGSHGIMWPADLDPTHDCPFDRAMKGEDNG